MRTLVLITLALTMVLSAPYAVSAKKDHPRLQEHAHKKRMKKAAKKDPAAGGHKLFKHKKKSAG